MLEYRDLLFGPVVVNFEIVLAQRSDELAGLILHGDHRAHQAHADFEDRR
jgi:hypothetical protein